MVRCVSIRPARPTSFSKSTARNPGSKSIGKTAFIAVALDRSLGLLAALDSAAKLHIYQQHIRVGIFETGLTIDEEFRPTLAISQDGTALFLTDGQHHCPDGLRRAGAQAA